MQDIRNLNIRLDSIAVVLRVYTDIIGTYHESRANHGILYNVKGELLFDFYEIDVKIKAEPGNIVYIPKGQKYIITKSGDNEGSVIDFSSEDCPFDMPFTIKSHYKDAYLKSFSEAEKAWERKKSGFILKANACFYEIMHILQKDMISQYLPSSKMKIISPALDYISKNYYKEVISVPKLAELCKISETYLRRLFYSLVGTQPIKYINDLKIERAKELLRSGRYSVQKTAEACGYSDLALFSSEFKKSVGLSPTAYINDRDNYS